MTFQSECNNIRNVKTGLRKSIQRNDGNLTIEDRLEVYPDAIAEMQAGPKTIDNTGVADYTADALNIITLPNNITKIRDYAFADDKTIIGICILANEVVELGRDVFKGTKIDSTGPDHGYIYVPSNLVSAYKADTNWQYYSDIIVSTSSMPTANTIHIIETVDKHRTIQYMNSTKISNFQS